MLAHGAGSGYFLGFFISLFGIFFIPSAINFLRCISNKSYLETEDAWGINFRKGFYSSAIFGGIVGWVCCEQWKNDMISVLEGTPNLASQNKHKVFRTACYFYICIVLLLAICGLVYFIIPDTQLSETYDICAKDGITSQECKSSQEKNGIMCTWDKWPNIRCSRKR